MNFKTLKNQPVSEKIVLIEIDLPVLCEIFINYEAGMWRTRLSPALNGAVTIEGSDSELGYYEDDDNERYIIMSLKIGVYDFTLCNTIEECREQDTSFYYDRETTDLYIHFHYYDYPLDKLVRPGAVNGYCDKVDSSRPLKSYYNDIYYDPCISKVPNLSSSKDPLFFGVLSFNPGSISLRNQDGEFDRYDELDVYGQPVRVYLGFRGFDREEFFQVYGGYLEDFANDYKEFTINIQDRRKKLSRSVPVNAFSTANYSLLDESDEGKPIPLIYGSVRKISGTYIGGKYFVVCDCSNRSIQSVTSYIDGIETSCTGGSNGIVYIPAYDEESSGEVLFDVEGFVDDEDNLIENGLDVIRDLLYWYADESYLSINFNIIEWAYETARSRKVQQFISDKTEINKIIEEICVALDGMFRVQRDNRYTFRSFDIDREPVKIIYPDEWLGEHKIRYDASEFLSSCIVKYDKNFSPGDNEQEYRTVINKDYEIDTVKRYKVYQEKEFETCLTDEADAIEKSEIIMSRSKEITPIVENKTKTQNVDLEVMDFVIAEHGRKNAKERIWAIYEVLSVGLNIIKAEVPLKLKYIKPYILTETKYTQGYLLGDTLFGDTMLGSTTYEEVEAA